MTSKRYMMALAIAASLVSFAAYAGDNIPPGVDSNLRVQAAAGACMPLTAVDASRLALRYNALALVNTSTGNALAACSPNVDVSGNGTYEAGLYVSNNDGGTSPVNVTCTITYNTAGQGAKQSNKTVTANPGTINKVSWTTADFIAFGGPVTFICNLPPKAGVMRVYTRSQQSS